MLGNSKYSEKRLGGLSVGGRKSSSVSKQAGPSMVAGKATKGRKVVYSGLPRRSARNLKTESRLELPELDFERAVCSVKRRPPVLAYAVNTHRGIVRTANEDKISVVEHFEAGYQNCHFFGLYDGHGGSGIAEYLARELHRVLAGQMALQGSFEEAARAAFR